MPHITKIGSPLSMIERVRRLGMLNIEEFLCSFLRGEQSRWPDAAGEAFADDVLARAGYHGVLPLVYDRLQRAPASAQGWPLRVLQACRDDALGHAMWELHHRDRLTRVLAQLATTNVRPVLFKGTALAYRNYPRAALRVRSDTDLIIAPEARPEAAAALEAQGFSKQLDAGGDFVFHQASFVSHGEGGGTHAVDLHWRINNLELWSRLFSYQELLRRACAVPQLGAGALAAGNVDALLLACMHRATHERAPYYCDGQAHYGGDRLIWLYDIHLLVGGFSRQDWDDMIGRAREKGLLAVCLEGLERARTRFCTAVPEPVLAALRPQGKPEALARYLLSGGLRQQWLEYCAIAGLGNKVGFLVDSVFPPASYMAQKYSQAQTRWLPWLYLRRVVAGVLRRMHPREDAS